MVERVAVSADGLAAHPELVSELGPVQWLDVSGWRAWSAAEMRALEPLFARLTVVARRGPELPAVSWQTNFRHVDEALAGVIGCGLLREVALLDLRSVYRAAGVVRDLRAGAKAGRLPPVLLRQNVVTTRQVGGYAYQDSVQAVHVIDPRGRWDALRLWFADFTGEVLDPVRL